MSTRRATRQDLLDLTTPPNPYDTTSKPKNKIKIFHNGCKKGRVTAMGKVLSCKECGMQWGSKRPETWTDDEIANKFWCEVPPENTVYVMKESDSGFTYLAPAPEKKTEPVEAAKAPSDPLLQKMLKAVGKY